MTDTIIVKAGTSSTWEECEERMKQKLVFELHYFDQPRDSDQIDVLASKYNYICGIKTDPGIRYMCPRNK